MPEIGTSGSMSGDGKRSVAEWPKLPRPSSTLPFETCRWPLGMSAYGEAVRRESALPHTTGRDAVSGRLIRSL
jgi:hypothetical protein